MMEQLVDVRTFVFVLSQEMLQHQPHQHPHQLQQLQLPAGDRQRDCEIPDSQRLETASSLCVLHPTVSVVPR